MTDERSYSYEMEIGISMVNENGALKPSAYQQLAMQLVEPHLVNIEMDEQRLIEGYGVAWVLLSMHFALHRPIRARARLTGRTWCSGISHRMFRREMEFFDAAGARVMTAVNFSTLFDLASRHICTDAETIRRFTFQPGPQLLELPARQRLKTPERPPVETRTMRPSWIDGVGHVNNVRYGELLYDALTDAQRARMGALARLELHFFSETACGETLALHRLDAPDSATVTATRPGEKRPAFAGIVTFGDGAPPRADTP